jgi:hypothetical protein
MHLVEAISSLGDFQVDDSGAGKATLGVRGWTKIETTKQCHPKIPIDIMETRIALGETSFFVAANEHRYGQSGDFRIP